MPEKKIAAAGIAGAIATCLVWLTGQFGVDMPADVGAAFASLICVGAGYLKKP